MDDSALWSEMQRERGWWNFWQRLWSVGKGAMEWRCAVLWTREGLWGELSYALIANSLLLSFNTDISPMSIIVQWLPICWNMWCVVLTSWRSYSVLLGLFTVSTERLGYNESILTFCHLKSSSEILFMLQHVETALIEIPALQHSWLPLIPGVQ